jgi:hypothetical protein
MFDKLGKEIDAVSIGTPDFSHFPIAMLAMSLGKHVYVEKPMGHSFRQMELMMAAEQKYKVAAQMGNQGHSEANYFQFKAWTEAGIIKNVTKITAYMNNARRWHGMKVDRLPARTTRAGNARLGLLAGDGETHPYNKGYINGEWRSWFDFGNGALGDWGAHIFDTAHEFLDLGPAHRSEAVLLEGPSPFISRKPRRWRSSSPRAARCRRWNSPGMTARTICRRCPTTSAPPWWTETFRPFDAGTLDTKKRPPGKVIYGEGLTFKGGSHGTTLKIIPEAKPRTGIKLPEVPKSPSNHFANFLKACKGEEKCRSSLPSPGRSARRWPSGSSRNKLTPGCCLTGPPASSPTARLAMNCLRVRRPGRIGSSITRCKRPRLLRNGTDDGRRQTHVVVLVAVLDSDLVSRTRSTTRPNRKTKRSRAALRLSIATLPPGR